MKTYVFIDAANIIYGAKGSGGWKVDFNRLYSYLKKKYKAEKVFYYAGYDPENQSDIVNIEFLEKIGYTTKIKPITKIFLKPFLVKERCPKCKHKWNKLLNKNTKIKANCDVDLTLDATSKSNEYDRAVFLTGDGDFLSLFTWLSQNKKELLLIGESKITSRKLKMFFKERFSDLVSISSQIKK